MNDDHEPARLDAMSGDSAFLREALGEARRERPGADDLARLATRLGAATGVVVTPPAPSGAAPSGAAPSSTMGDVVTSPWWAGATTKIGIVALVLGGSGAAYFGTRDADLAQGASAGESRGEPAPNASTDASAPDDAIRSAPAAAKPLSSASFDSAVSPPIATARSLAPRSAPSLTTSVEPRREGAIVEVEPEIALLERARRQLTSSPFAALATTDEHARAYPRGALSQERDVLAIDALVRLGRRADAERRVDAFRAQHPGSPYLRRLDRLVDGGANDQKAGDQKVPP